MSKLKLELSEDLDLRLNEISEKLKINKAETIKKAFALLSIAVDEHEKGNSLGIIKEDPETQQFNVVHKIVGLTLDK